MNIISALKKLYSDALGRMIIVLVAVSMLHFTHVPIWVNVVTYTFILSRLFYFYQNKFSPVHPWLLEAMTVTFFLILCKQFMELGTLETLVSLLMILASSRLHFRLNLKNKFTLVFAIYFIIIVDFLFSQELWLMGYLILCTILTTIILVDASHPHSTLSFKEAFKVSSGVVFSAIPLMILIFFLFPRISTPLFGFMEPKKALKSGITDTMTIGDVFDVAKSDEVVFRASFTNNINYDKKLLYWRGIVLNNFDGRTWNKVPNIFHGTHIVQVVEAGVEADYEVILEQQDTRWMFSLDPPSQRDIIDGAKYDAELQLATVTPNHKRLMYHSRSFSQGYIKEDLTDEQKYFYLRYPKSLNLKSQKLMNDLLQQNLSQEQIVQKILNMYHTQDYYYSYSSPLLGQNAVDDFIFKAKNGFCEQYASTFAVLMRMANIPSRVIVGYEGGEKNDVGNYYIIKQRDAHAWVEVWLNGRWVKIDPTSAIASDHVDLTNQDNNLTTQIAGKNGSNFLRNLFAPLMNRIDWLNNTWNKWFLGYNNQRQKDFLKKFGLYNWQQMSITLVIVLCFFMTIFGVIFLKTDFKNRSNEKAVILWEKLLKKLKKADIQQNIGEGVLTFCKRIEQINPQLAPKIWEIGYLYQQIRYAKTENKNELEKQLKEKVFDFKVDKKI